MRRVVDLALSVAASDAPVLISGPSGCGKEKVAEIIVANSRRPSGPFVRVNVGAIPEELLESELFGAEPGAYTGARALRIGRFETAGGGTLFLDEVDALSLAGQVKLLRVLSSGEFQRLGSSRTREADVRLLSATNADLEGAVGAGGFRQDLYYRINVVSIRVPPLAARPEDVLPLARHFLAARAVEAGGEAKEISGGAASALLAHSWPGNVRELANRVHRASLVSGQLIEAADLGLGEEADTEPAAALGVEELEERLRLDRVLREEAGSVTRAAQALGVSRQALYRKMARLGIGVERRVK
jgi:DNA-binding NtrC family response regulator